MRACTAIARGGEPEHEPDLRRELTGSNNVTVIDGNAPWSADFTVVPNPSERDDHSRAIGDVHTYGDAARLVYQPDQLLLHRIACTGRLHVQPCLGHPEFQHRNHDPDHHYCGPHCVPSVPVWSSVESSVRDLAGAASHAAGHGGDGCA